MEQLQMEGSRDERAVPRDHGFTENRQMDQLEYLQLGHVQELDIEEFEALQPVAIVGKWRRRWKWIRILILVIAAAVVGIAFAMWGLPLLLDQVIIPMLLWVATKFTKVNLALLMIATMAIFPIFLIPSAPTMWLAGMIFGYGIGFCIIMVGTTIGQTLPFFLGRWLLHSHIQRWLGKWPKKAAVLRAAEQSSWFNQIRIIALLRVSPIPYPLFNYAVAATNIKFGPYIYGSFAGMIPESLITIYSGRLLGSLANAKHKNVRLDTVEIISNVVGFIVAAGVGIGATMYGQRALREMELADSIVSENIEDNDGMSLHQQAEMDGQELKRPFSFSSMRPLESLETRTFDGTRTEDHFMAMGSHYISMDYVTLNHDEVPNARGIHEHLNPI